MNHKKTKQSPEFESRDVADPSAQVPTAATDDSAQHKDTASADTAAANETQQGLSEQAGADTAQIDDDAQPKAPEQVDADIAATHLAEAESKVADCLDKLTRSQAELQNVRKRAEREMAQVRKYANEQFATELLAIKDSLELSLAEDSTVDSKKLREGIELTLKLLEQIFNRFDIIEINPQGEVFDPEYHQAMMTQVDKTQPPNTVLQVMQKGYRLDKRLLRAAMVCVSSAVDQSPAAEQPPQAKEKHDK